MGVEAQYRPTLEDIAQAEQRRVVGDYRGATSLVRPALARVIEHGLDNLSVQEQAGILASLRLLCSAELSAANQSWNAPTAAFWLEEAAFSMSRGYGHPEIQEATQSIRVGPFGESYDHPTEQLRDRAKFFLSLAALTGNTGFVDEAIKTLERAAAQSREPTARTLARFELAVLERRRNRQTFKEVETRAGEALFAAYDKGNWERATTIGSRFFLLSIKEGRFRTAGLFALHTLACVVNDSSLATIPFREAWKMLTAWIRKTALRWTTPSGVCYDYIADRAEKRSYVGVEDRELSEQILLESYRLLTHRGKLIDDGKMIQAEFLQYDGIDRSCPQVIITHSLSGSLDHNQCRVDKNAPYHTIVRVVFPQNDAEGHWIDVQLGEGRSAASSSDSFVLNGDAHGQQLQTTLAFLREIPS
ncbi:MAG: hypothetical protein Q8R11_01800 [bacterium]|nr:hypothetical protein [bacterium]